MCELCSLRDLLREWPRDLLRWERLFDHERRLRDRLLDLDLDLDHPEEEDERARRNVDTSFFDLFWERDRLLWLRDLDFRELERRVLVRERPGKMTKIQLG